MKKVFPHITIILSVMTLTFFVIERFNAMMAFMTSRLSQWVFAALAVLAIITSIRLIKADWDADRRARERQARLERQAMRRRMQESGETAPEPEAAAGVCPVSHYVTEHMLGLPCDQRYSLQDMDFIADMLTEVLG